MTAKGWNTVEEYFADPVGYEAHRKYKIRESIEAERQATERAGEQQVKANEVLAYARNVFGKPWAMNRDNILAIEHYLETGELLSNAKHLSEIVIDEIVSILTWRQLYKQDKEP